MYFYAAPQKNANLLIFEVASQKDNDYFTIERTSDLINWERTHIIKGDGTIQEQRKYTVMDFEYVKSVNYYRLIQTDFNGKQSIARTISIDNSEKERSFLYSINSMGQRISSQAPGLVIDIYSDGSTVKRLNN